MTAAIKQEGSDKSGNPRKTPVEKVGGDKAKMRSVLLQKHTHNKSLLIDFHKRRDCDITVYIHGH